MNTQTKLSDIDAAKLALLHARQRVLNEETKALFAELLAAYGNPGEGLAVGEDGRSLIRTPAPPAPRSKKRKR